jgi:hypothetical protein
MPVLKASGGNLLGDIACEKRSRPDGLKEVACQVAGVKRPNNGGKMDEEAQVPRRGLAFLIRKEGICWLRSKLQTY